METAWLIERGVNGFPEWLEGLDAYADDCIAAWTNDPSRPIRFCRKSDAEAILPALGGRYGKLTVTEHLWG